MSKALKGSDVKFWKTMSDIRLQQCFYGLLIQIACIAEMSGVGCAGIDGKICILLVLSNSI